MAWNQVRGYLQLRSTNTSSKACNPADRLEPVRRNSKVRHSGFTKQKIEGIQEFFSSLLSHKDIKLKKVG
jgi:hypothetical protein